MKICLMMTVIGLTLAQNPTYATDVATTGYGDDIDASQAHNDAQVQRIKKAEEDTLHDLGMKGTSVDDAERRWEEITTQHLVAERTQLGKAVKAGTMPEAKAKEIIEDDYHAVLEAAKLVEAELKEHHIVRADHKMPTPLRSDNVHGYTAPTPGAHHEESTNAHGYAAPAIPSSASLIADESDDPIDAAQDHYNAEVQRIKAAEEHTLHALGERGILIDDAEREWEGIAKGRLSQERDMLLAAVRTGTMPEAKAKEILEDEYNAVLEAAKLVEAELKENHIVSVDHKLPSDNVHSYTAPATPTTSWEYTTPSPGNLPKYGGAHHEESTNAYVYAAPAPANPDEGEAQWEAEVQRIEALEKKTLRALGVSGLGVDEAEAKWSEQVSTRLSAEAKLLRVLVLEHRMRAADAEERLGDDYAAAREAAKRVDAELNAHGIHLHHPAFPAAPRPTGNLRGKTHKQDEQQMIDSDAATLTAASTTKANKITAADGDFVGQVIYRKGEPDAATAATAATTKTSKTPIAADGGTSSPTTSNDAASSGEGSSGGAKLFGLGIAPVAGIAMGLVGLIALAAVGVSKARGGGGGGQRPSERRVLRVSSTAAGATRSPTSSVIRHTNFVQML